MFESIEEYYQYLEHDNSLSQDLNISKRIVFLRDKSQDQELKAKWSYELYFNDLRIENGEIKPHISCINKQGVTIDYPNLTLFDDDLIYIKTRAENANNPKYKAKYNHILWGSNRKHADFAKLAIDNYFSFLKSVSFLLEDNLSNGCFGNYFKTLFTLTQNVKYKKAESLIFLSSILNTKKISGFQEYLLMKYVAEEGKKIDASSLQFFFTYANHVIDDDIYPDHLQQYLELLLILCQKLNVSQIDYHNKLAELHIKQSEKLKDSFIVHDSYLKALYQYQKAGNKKKIEEVTLLVEHAKNDLNFKLIKVEHTDERLEKWYEAIDKLTDELIQNYQSTYIFDYIIHSNHILPKADVLKTKVQSVLFDLISVMTFDINKNVNTKNEKIINGYFIHIQNFSLPHLWMIFRKGIKSGKISYESLVEYLYNHSWYGTDSSFINADGIIEGFNWIELLCPSFFSFFNQMEIDVKLNKENQQPYILAIDSLVLKFEGLLRDFSRKIGAQTIEIKENGTEERISIEKLLDNSKIIDLIPENDIALFKFLFLSEGMDLRNNVAHCFYKASNYSPSIMLLVLTAFLKLGNYKLSIPE